MEKLTKEQMKEARKMEWQGKAAKQERSAKLKKIGIWIGGILGIAAFVGILVWLASSPAPTSTITAAAVSEKDISKGPQNPKATLIEYSDFQCPACKAYYQTVNQISEEYKDSLRVVYRNFPLANVHKNATLAAQASYAAHNQGKFWEYHDLLFQNQESWAAEGNPRAKFEEYATELELDIELFKLDMESEETKNFVESQRQEALNAGANSTPTFVLNGKQLLNPGTYEAFKKAIDEALTSE